MTARKRPHRLVAQLVEERRVLDMTRRETALTAGIDRVTIDVAETGRRTPSLETLEAWAKALGMVVTLVHIGDKYCRTCDTTKPIRHFGADRRSPDGLANRCGTCVANGTYQRELQDPDTRTALEQRRAASAKGRAQLQAVVAKRQERFVRLRSEGWGVAAAGAEVSVSYRTAQKYEALRLAHLKQEVAA